MSNEQTERLILDLAAGLTPVRALPPVGARLAAWIVPAFAVAAAMVWWIGARADWAIAIGNPQVALTLTLTSATAIAAAIVALRLSVPGSLESKWSRWLPIGVVALWLIALAQAMRVGDPGTTGAALHVICVIRVAAIAAVPTALLARSVRRGYALDRVWPPVLVAAGGGAVGAAAIELICPIDQAAHMLISHAAPLVAMMLIGAVLPSLRHGA